MKSIVHTSNFCILGEVGWQEGELVLRKHTADIIHASDQKAG